MTSTELYNEETKNKTKQLSSQIRPNNSIKINDRTRTHLPVAEV